jgi:hypothetical protein
MPRIDGTLDHRTMNGMSTGVKAAIKEHHKNSINLGNNYHVLDHDGGKLYYRYDGGPRELSYIKYDMQVGVDKNGGDVSHIHNFMKHHIDERHRLVSDKLNTKGSVKLWKDFIKLNKNYKYETWNLKTHEKSKIDHNSIDTETNNIWGHHKDFENIRVLATK